MTPDGRPERGDEILVRSGAQTRWAKVIDYQMHLFAADEYLIRYPDGSGEIVVGRRIIDARPGDREGDGR